MNQNFQVKILKTDDYIRILQDEKKLTFAVVVGDQEFHQQISILDYDTAEKIEQKMAEVGVQVYEELQNTNNSQMNAPIPIDIQALVDAAPLS